MSSSDAKNTSPNRKKAKVTEDGGTDDNQPTTDNPNPITVPVITIEPAHLPDSEKLILSKGLTFVPYKHIPITQVTTDLDLFQDSLISKATLFAFDICTKTLTYSN